MSCTPEERREINKRNAMRSTGPRTASGKDISRKNALKHGLRAEEYSLLGEDRAQLKQLTDEWVEYYQPRSPGERASLDRCVYATVQLQRCARYHADSVAEQVRKAQEQWHRDQEDEVAGLKKQLETEPDEASRLLKRSTLGCRWMIAEWRKLRAILDRGKTWVLPEREKAIRMLGERPGSAHHRDNPMSFLIGYYTLLSWTKPSARAIAELIRPEATPDPPP
jgi:hypothetical protein